MALKVRRTPAVRRTVYTCWVRRRCQSAAKPIGIGSQNAIAPAINRPLEWLFGRPILTPLNVQRALDDFYAGMSIARRSPLNVAASLVFNIIRYLAGAAALYFSFHAMEWTISPGALILIFTTVSFMSSVSAVPG